MKQIFLLVFFSLNFTASQGQDYPTISNNRDAVWISPTVEFVVGTDIKVGTGSTADGSFKYIRISSQSWMYNSPKNGKNSRTVNEANSLPISFTGLRMHIKKLRIIGNENRGYIIYLVLGGGTATNYEYDISQAVKAGEIECNGCEALQKNNSNVAIVNQFSTADELAKLKKLKDEGVLSEVEYRAQKEKLLSK